MMRKISFILALCASTSLAAQQTPAPVANGSGVTPLFVPAFGGMGSTPTPVDASHGFPISAVGGFQKQETFQLVTGNTPSIPATVFGGTYAFNQICTGYGVLTLRYRAADGITMLPLASFNASDSSGATMISLGSGQIVDVIATGTTGCNATLTRVP